MTHIGGPSAAPPPSQDGLPSSSSSLREMPFDHRSAAFLETVPIPPFVLLVAATLLCTLLNALLNYVLARSLDIPILKPKGTTRSSGTANFGSPLAPVTSPFAGKSATRAPMPSGSAADGEKIPLLSVTSPTDAQPSFADLPTELEESFVRSPEGSFATAGNNSFSRGYFGTAMHLGGVAGKASPLGLRAARQHSHHAYLLSKARRLRQTADIADLRTAAADTIDAENEYVTGEQLHYPSSPFPTAEAEEFTEMEDGPGAETYASLELPPPVVSVFATSTVAQSMYQGANNETTESEQKVNQVDAAVAIAEFVSKLKEVRLEAQYVVFDTNRMFLLLSVVKCLAILVLLHYALDIRGGWDRFTVATGAQLMCGILSPALQLLSAALLPNDMESRNAARRRQQDKADNESDEAHSILLVEWVLSHCTYDFKDLTTVFIQGSMFILTGIVTIPPLLSYCGWAMLSYAWLFVIPAVVWHRIRRHYFDLHQDHGLLSLMYGHSGGSQRHHTTTSSYAWVASLSSEARDHRIRLQGALELTKCVLLKSSIMLILLWAMQASFLLSAIWRNSPSAGSPWHRYVVPVERLWSDELILSPTAYWSRVVTSTNPTFWALCVASQLLL